MKLIAVLLLAAVVAIAAAQDAGPISVTNNNAGDIVSVGINAQLTASNTINQDIVNVIIALLNQQAQVIPLSANNDDTTHQQLN